MRQRPPPANNFLPLWPQTTNYQGPRERMPSSYYSQCPNAPRLGTYSQCPTTNVPQSFLRPHSSCLFVRVSALWLCHIKAVRAGARPRDWKITCGDFFLHVHYSTLVDGPIRSDWNISAGRWTLLSFQSRYALVRPFPDRRRGGLASIDRRDRSQFYSVPTRRRPTNLSKEEEGLILTPNGLQNRDRHL